MSQVVRNIRKLFIGNLPWTIGNNELKLYFSKYGHVSNATVIFDKNKGISKGYAFIAFSTNDGFENAKNKQFHTLEGRILTVEPASA